MFGAQTGGLNVDTHAHEVPYTKPDLTGVGSWGGGVRRGMGSKGCLSLCYLLPVQNSKPSENSKFERNRWDHYADGKMAFFNNSFIGNFEIFSYLKVGLHSLGDCKC